LDVDVVLTHQPPFGQVGTVLELGAYNYRENYGSYTLYEKLTNPECRIKYLLCGHIHSGQHTVEMIGKTKCYNVSLKNERYKVAFQPLELSI